MREASDIQPKYIAYFLVSLVIMAVVIHIAMWWVFDTFSRHDLKQDVVRSRVQPPDAAPPGPRLQTNPEEDNRGTIERESRILNEYGWVDPAGGIAHVPIERAMQIVIERGVK